MRRAFSNKKFIIDDDGTFYGVSLGYDYCAEHEWGIDGIIRQFKINTDELGVQGRKVNTSEVFLVKDDNMCVLSSDMRLKDETDPKKCLPYDLKNLYNDDIETAWSERGFCVVTKNKDNFKYLEDLHQGFMDQDIAITSLAEGNPFENTSLSLVFISRLPKESTDQMTHVDLKQQNLVAYEEKIGVAKLKREYNGRYNEENYFLACSPKWINYEDEEERDKQKKKYGTEYDIIFWINYSDDDDNNGWYTAEDIIKWLTTPGLKLKSLNKVL